jgi:hypothetical protein
LVKDIQAEYNELMGGKQMNIDEALEKLDQKIGIDIKYWKGACDYVGYLRALLIKIAKNI